MSQRSPSQGSDDSAVHAHTQPLFASPTPYAGANYGRIQLDVGLIRNAQGSFGVAVKRLAVAARAPQSISYLKRELGSALDAFLSMKDIRLENWEKELDMLMSIVRKIKFIVDAVRKQCESSTPCDGTLPSFLLWPLTVLETLATTLEILNMDLGTDVTPVRFTLSKAQDRVRQCELHLQHALDMLTTSLRDNDSALSHTSSNSGNFEPSGSAESWPLCLPDPVSSSDVATAGIMRISPGLHGRSDELHLIVNAILYNSQAHIAILGPGGIGKSRLATTVLDDDRMLGRYGHRRFMVSCERLKTAEEIAERLLDLTDLRGSFIRHSSLQELLQAHMSCQSNALICLDGLRTVWNTDSQAVETLLSGLAALARVAIIVTSRGEAVPLSLSWSEPLFSPLSPLRHEAMWEIWSEIGSDHSFRVSEVPLEDIGGSPLAITLLAALRQNFFAREILSLVGRGLGNKDRMPEVGLMEKDKYYILPPLPEDINIVLLLIVICILPQGLRRGRLPEFIYHFRQVLHGVESSLTLLGECSLVFNHGEFIVVRASVRALVLENSNILSEAFTCLLDLYTALLDRIPDDTASKQSYQQSLINPEILNISRVLLLSVKYDITLYREEQVLSLICALKRFDEESSSEDLELLSESIFYAQKHHFILSEAQLWHAKGQCLLRLEGCTDETLSAFRAAHWLYNQLGDEVGKSTSLLALGRVYKARGHSEHAEHALRSALELFRNRIDDTYIKEAYTLSDLASVHQSMGRLDDAKLELESLVELVDTFDVPETIGDDARKNLRTIDAHHRWFGAHDSLVDDKAGTHASRPRDRASSMQSHSTSKPSSTHSPLQVLRRRRHRLRDPSPSDDPAKHRDEQSKPSMRRPISEDQFVLGVVEIAFPSILPLVQSPEGESSAILIAVSFLGRYTCYRRLCELEKTKNGEDDIRFEHIKGELLQHWMVMITVLAAILAMAITVFVAASGSVIPVGNMALLCLGVSASAAALGFMVCSALLIRCWHVNAEQFRTLALGLYEDYCFFAIASSIPSLALLLASLFIMLCVLVIAGGAWPRTVISLSVIFGVLLGLEYIIKSGEIVLKALRRGVRAMLGRSGPFLAAAWTSITVGFLAVLPTSARTTV
ncbi:unnamed protein product [Peniophora sp. CBMAI 1063]|nr:unnamed protein product [Peniophora sp. CBMAI 1063]